MSTSPAQRGRANRDSIPFTELEEVKVAEPVAPAARSTFTVLITVGRIGVWALVLLGALTAGGAATRGASLEAIQHIASGTAAAFALDRILSLVNGFDSAQARP
jgi:hypothetical protein